jgi:hypothetical protein
MLYEVVQQYVTDISSLLDDETRVFLQDALSTLVAADVVQDDGPEDAIFYDRFPDYEFSRERNQNVHLPPLHIQFPPVRLLDWTKVQTLVETSSSRHEVSVFKLLSLPYRNELAAQALHRAARAITYKTRQSSVLFTTPEVQALEKAGFAIRNEDDPEIAHIVKVFTLIEDKPSGPRRRIITWPEFANKIEKVLWLACKRKGSIPFATGGSQTTWASASTRFGCCADFVKFFQQFAILPSCRRYFRFRCGSRLYQLLTIPTGSVSSPIIAQIVSRAIAATACNISTRDRLQHGLQYHVMIDNIRFVANSEALLLRVWQSFADVCRLALVTVGDVTAPTNGSYVFVGLIHNHTNSTVTLSEKSVSKLQTFKNSPDWRADSVERIFGLLNYASTALHVSLAPYYYVVKYYRRISTLGSSRGDLWECCRHLMLTWIDEVATKVYAAKSVSVSSNVVFVFTDASLTGWGGVVLLDDHFLAIGRRWSAKVLALTMDINVLEAMALRNVVRHMTSVWRLANLSLRVFIDNTTTLAACRTSSARNFVTNSLTLEFNSLLADSNLRLLSADWIASEDNVADYWSRLTHSVAATTLIVESEPVKVTPHELDNDLRLYFDQQPRETDVDVATCRQPYGYVD